MTRQVDNIAMSDSLVVVQLRPAIDMTDDQFYELCQLNRDLRMERTVKGELIIMPPVGGEGSKRNADLTTDLNLWNRQTRLGVVFDSSGGFKLPLGGDRSPDASWIRLERWEGLTPKQRQKFLPLCPDFLIELRSETDSIEALREKMQEYLDNALRLGWLIDPETKNVEIYRQNRKVEVLESPARLSGEDVLPGFMLDLQLIFN